MGTPNRDSHAVPTEPGLAARFLAFEALQDNAVKALPTERIWTLADRYEIPSRERALAFDLLAGGIKHRLSLDHLIERFSRRSTQRMTSSVLTLLRLGVYQLMYEDRIPDFAAVDTICELAKRYVKRPQVGFINAILRNLQRSVEARSVPLEEGNIRQVLPVGLRTGVKFSRELFPGRSSPAGHLSLAYSYPKWLVARWLLKWGFDALREILAAGNARPALVCRPNRIKLGEPAAAELARILADQACQAKVLPDVGMVELLEHPPITELAAFRDGLFQVQDPTAAEPVKNLSPVPGQILLDLCAGLGTKTTQLAEETSDQAQIFASDRLEDRLERLRQNADRLGIKSVQTISLADLAADRFGHFFDVVLLDVPCSNTGVLDRRPEARWRLREGDFQTYVRQSRQLLDRARGLVKPGGRILFSTCSIDEEENARLIQAFNAQAGWRIQKEHGQLPRLDTDTGRTCRTGGYWALLESS